MFSVLSFLLAQCSQSHASACPCILCQSRNPYIDNSHNPNIQSLCSLFSLFFSLNTSNHTLALVCVFYDSPYIDNSHNPIIQSLCSLFSSRSIFPIIRWRFYVGLAIKGSEISRSHQGGICRWRNNYCSRHKIHQILAPSQGFLGSRPHICHFFSTNVLLGSIFLHVKFRDNTAWITDLATKRHKLQ